MPILIRGAQILRGNLDVQRADVLLNRGIITAIEPPNVITDENLDTVDAADQLLVPGLVNAHTHSHGALGKGLVPDRVPLEVFLSGAGAINGHRGLEDKRLSATLSAVELVRKGCTAAFDLFVEVPGPSRDGLDAVAEAYASVCIRAVTTLARASASAARRPLKSSFVETTTSRPGAARSKSSPSSANLSVTNTRYATFENSLPP